MRVAMYPMLMEDDCKGVLKGNPKVRPFHRWRERLAWAIVIVQYLLFHFYHSSSDVPTTSSLYASVETNEGTTTTVRTATEDERKTFHNGGWPADNGGSCWCGADAYCMCTPALAIDLVIQDELEEYVWLVRRKDTNQLAVMGGFVMVGEAVEAAVVRELKEETGVDAQEHSLSLFGVYSDPKRDKRRHTVSSVYVVHLAASAVPKAADDVKEVIRISMSEIETMSPDNFFADHKTILMDYKYRKTNRDHLNAKTSVRGLKAGVKRSVCSSVSNFFPVF